MRKGRAFQKKGSKSTKARGEGRPRVGTERGLVGWSTGHEGHQEAILKNPAEHRLKTV